MNDSYTDVFALTPSQCCVTRGHQKEQMIRQHLRQSIPKARPTAKLTSFASPKCFQRFRYDKYGAALEPSPGDLIGSGTVGRLVPLALSASGGAISQFLWVLGAVNASFWGLGCAFSLGGSWLKANRRLAGGKRDGDSAVPAIVGGFVLGNAAGFIVGLGVRGTARLLLGRRSA